MKPKVYLAGKISSDDWRHSLFTNNDASFSVGQPGRWEWNDRPAALEAGSTEISSWPRLEFDVVGPFFVDMGHGASHGEGTHASSDGDRPTIALGAMRNTHRLCLQAIARCDIFFAWLDDPTAYGTLAEIGFAFAYSQQKMVAIGVPFCEHYRDGFVDWSGHGDSLCRCLGHGDLWFAARMGNPLVWSQNGPQAALAHVVTKWQQDNITFDSDVERQFWDAHCDAGRPIADLTPQHEIKANGRNYRLDFFSPSTMRAIEVDGLAYHNGQESFIRDRNRQRDLEMAGIRVLRFAAKEVMTDAQGCVRQAAQWAAAA